MKVGDLVRIKEDRRNHYSSEWVRDPIIWGKLAIIVINGTWSVDVRIFENGSNHRIAKEDCEVISESR